MDVRKKREGEEGESERGQWWENRERGWGAEEGREGRWQDREWCSILKSKDTPRKKM